MTVWCYIVIPHPTNCTGGLASICNNEYINLVSRETDFAASRAVMAITSSGLIQFRAAGKKDNVESQEARKSSVKSQKCSKFF